MSQMTQLAEARDDLAHGRITAGEAEQVLTEAEAFRLTLVRRGHRGYADEIQELQDLAKQLRAAILGRPDAPVVCIFRRPARRGLPALMVVRLEQTAFIELDGRQRVRDWWGLMVDGRIHVEGPKRWIMKNAQGAAMMNSLGQIPLWITLVGLAKRRSLYKRRRDRRRLEGARKTARMKNRRAARRGSTDRWYVGADSRVTFQSPEARAIFGDWTRVVSRP